MKKYLPFIIFGVVIGFAFILVSFVEKPKEKIYLYGDGQVDVGVMIPFDYVERLKNAGFPQGEGLGTYYLDLPEDESPIPDTPFDADISVKVPTVEEYIDGTPDFYGFEVSGKGYIAYTEDHVVESYGKTIEYALGNLFLELYE